MFHPLRKLKSFSSRCTAAALLAGAVVFTGMAAAAPAQAASPNPIRVTDYQTATPKTIVMDVRSGAVVSATAGMPSSGAASPLIGNHNICNTGDGCYYTNAVPYANQGFYGSPGTYYGSWPYRNAWWTGSYTARACWVGACSQYAFGPNTYVTFNGATATGTSFRIY